MCSSQWEMRLGRRVSGKDGKTGDACLLKEERVNSDFVARELAPAGLRSSPKEGPLRAPAGASSLATKSLFTPVSYTHLTLPTIYSV